MTNSRGLTRYCPFLLITAIFMAVAIITLNTGYYQPKEKYSKLKHVTQVHFENLTISETIIIEARKEETIIYDTSNTFSSSRINRIEEIEEIEQFTTFKDEIEFKTNVMKTLPENDYKSLYDIKNFNFTIFHKICTEPILFLVLIHSDPNNMDKREAIRKSWGAAKGVKLLFVVGTRTDENNIKKESHEHKDILQGNFQDAYRNLTYKHVALLKYTLYHCPQTKYLVKVDDDMYINIPALTFMLEQRELCSTPNKILCFYHADDFALREKSKWAVTYKEYPDLRYPTFCLGNYPIIYAWNLIFEIYQGVNEENFFWIDDVLISGIIAKKKYIEHIQIKQHVLTRGDLNVLMNSNGTDGPTNFVFGPPSMSPHIMLELSHAMNKTNRDFKIQDDMCV